MANLAALAAARRAKAPADLTSKGAQCLRQAMRVYISEETHHSVAKAAVLLGLGQDNVRSVVVDERFKIRIDDLVAKITDDLAAGYLPFCVVANAGTVGTGAFDPLAQVSQVARRFNLWMHIDASFFFLTGCGAASSAKIYFPIGPKPIPSRSIRHKWLYLRSIVVCVVSRRGSSPRHIRARRR